MLSSADRTRDCRLSLGTMSHAKSLSTYDTLYCLLGEREVRVAKLERENESLRSQLEASTKPSATAARRTSNASQARSLDNNAVTEDTAATPLTTAGYEMLTTKYNDLAKLYRELEGKHMKCEANINRAMKYYREAKENARQWKAYVNRKDTAKTDSASVSTGIHTTNDDHLDPDVTPRPPRSSGAATITMSQQAKTAPPSARKTAVVPTLFARHVRGDEAPPTPCSGSHHARVSSSQTTQADSDPSTSSPPKLEPSSDSEPVVVSTRSLKRKRSESTTAMPSPVKIKQEPQSPTRLIEIRSEDYSSPVHRQPHLRTETSDLDALSAKLAFPRKRRAHDQRPRALSEEVRQAPPSLSSRTSSLSDSDLPTSDGIITNVKIEPELQAAALASADLTRESHPSAVVGRREANALRPLSVNLPATRNSALTAGPPKRKGVGERTTKVAALSEDGEDMSNQSATVSHLQPRRANTPQTHVSRRLDTMLDGPSPDKTPLIKNHNAVSCATQDRQPLAPTPRIARQPNRPSPGKPAERAPMQNNRPTTTRPHNAPLTNPPSSMKGMKRPPNIEDSPPPVRPEEEPLRSLPVAALGLEDFRVDPKFMDSNFAYSETLRGRDQRRCLPGCTSPECCGGTFRRAVELGGNAGSTKTDAEVLESYLGSNWEQLIGAYTADKRKDLLMQARASSFANQFGKHRHAFERRSTPPGFWRTDMPTTQEAEEDRRKAHEMERRKVEERWREAMREGGRWKFRDEC